MSVGLLLGLAATLYWSWDFWFAVTIPVSDYPRDIPSFWHHMNMMFAQPLVLFVLAAAAVATVAAVWRNGVRALATPLFFYPLVAAAFQTSVMTGIGAENHNLIEPALALLVWTVAALQMGRPRFELGLAWAAGLGALVWATQLELRNTDVSLYSFAEPAKAARYVEERERARAALRDLGFAHGKLLNLKTSQIPHDFPDNEVVLNDLWMYVTVLWNSRPETVERLVRALETETFDAVITSPGVVRADPNPNDTPWTRVSRALFAHYGLGWHGNDVNIHTRRQPPGS
jgi:hypothetical protein